MRRLLPAAAAVLWLGACFFRAAAAAGAAGAAIAGAAAPACAPGAGVGCLLAPAGLAGHAAALERHGFATVRQLLGFELTEPDLAEAGVATLYDRKRLHRLLAEQRAGGQQEPSCAVDPPPPVPPPPPPPPPPPVPPVPPPPVPPVPPVPPPPPPTPTPKSSAAADSERYEKLNEELRQAAADNEVAEVARLLESGASVWGQNARGNSALHDSAYFGHQVRPGPWMVGLLLTTAVPTTAC